MGKKAPDYIRPAPQVVQFLERQIRHADAKVRQNWIDDLPKQNPPAEPVVEMVADRLMRHENWYVRRSGASALVSCATDVKNAAPLATPWASKLLGSDDPEVRRCVGRYLEGVSAHADVLIHEAASVAELRPTEEEALRKYEARKAKEHAKINTIDSTARDGVGEAAAGLSHEDPSVRQTAVDALSRVGCRAEPHANAIAALLVDPDVVVRHEVIRAIRRLGAFMAGSAPRMAEFLACSEEVLVRTATNALKALSESSGPAAAAAAAAQLRNEDRETRVAALRALAVLGPLAAPHGDMIAERLGEEDKVVRFAAARTLVAAGPSVAPCVRAVAAHLKHQDADIHRSAINAMQGLAAMIPAVARSQGKVLREDPEDSGEYEMRQRRAAMTILGAAQKHAEPYLEDVGKEMESKDWTIRRASADCFEALGAFAEGKGAKEVSRRLLYEDPDVRRVAAETLGRMGKHVGDYAADVLILLETEEDIDVRNVAIAACHRLQAAGVLEGDIPEPQSPALRKRLARSTTSALSKTATGSLRSTTRGRRR